MELFGISGEILATLPADPLNGFPTPGSTANQGVNGYLDTEYVLSTQYPLPDAANTAGLFASRP